MLAFPKPRVLVGSMLLWAGACGSPKTTENPTPANAAGNIPAPQAEAQPQSGEDIDSRLSTIRGLTDRFLFDDALRLVNELIEDTQIEEEKVRLIVARGYIESRRGNAYEATHQLEIAQRKLEELDINGIARAEYLNAQATMAWTVREPERALELWRVALTHSQGTAKAPTRLRGRIRYNMAMIYSGRGDHQGAYDLLVEAHGDEEAGGAPRCPDLSATQGLLGQAASELGRHRSAIEHYDKAIAWCDGVGDSQIVVAMLKASKARALADAGEPDQAISLIREADSTLAQDPKAHDRRATVILNEVIILSQAQRQSEAIERAERARAELGAPTPGDRYFRLALCAKELFMLNAQKRYAESQEVGVDCLSMSEGVSNPREKQLRATIEQEIKVARTASR